MTGLVVTGMGSLISRGFTHGVGVAVGDTRVDLFNVGFSSLVFYVDRSQTRTLSAHLSRLLRTTPTAENLPHEDSQLGKLFIHSTNATPTFSTKFAKLVPVASAVKAVLEWSFARNR